MKDASDCAACHLWVELFEGTATILIAAGLLCATWLPQAMAQSGSDSNIEPAAPPRTVFRYGQRSPTRERYREIQTALKEHGYDPGPIDGQWGPKTSAALKRFERDNNLRADGRLDSLALIVLGLGPKRLNSVRASSE